jgi:hypothetical protein
MAFAAAIQAFQEWLILPQPTPSVIALCVFPILQAFVGLGEALGDERGGGHVPTGKFADPRTGYYWQSRWERVQELDWLVTGQPVRLQHILFYQASVLFCQPALPRPLLLSPRDVPGLLPWRLIPRRLLPRHHSIQHTGHCAAVLAQMSAAWFVVG